MNSKNLHTMCSQSTQHRKTSKVLKGTAASADLTLGYQTLRLARNRARYALLEKQVEHCTIRAPHDGFVIYANNADRQVFIEPGMSVRQRQQLFFLPDLSQMEVVADLHESIVERITPSMRRTFNLKASATNRPKAMSPRLRR